MIKLVLCDMDLTLVPHMQPTVTPLALQAFHELMDLGVRAGAASGRGVSDLRRQFAGDAACVRTAVASNGCQVFVDGELICHNPLSREELERALEVVRPLPGVFFTADLEGTRLAIGGKRDEVERRFANWTEARFELADDFPAGDLVKVNLTFDEKRAHAREVVAQLRPLTPTIDYCVLNGHVADLMPMGWNKARGAQALLDYLGLTTDELLVFGDSENDLPLMRAFPKSSVAVANAIPAVRDLARWHIGPCTEDACAHALLELAAALRDDREPSWMSGQANEAALRRATTDPTITSTYLHELWTRPKAS